MIISRRVVEAIGNEWLNQLDDSYKDFRPIKSDLKKEETFLWIYVPISSGDFLEKNLSNSKDGLCLLPKLIHWLYRSQKQKSNSHSHLTTWKQCLHNFEEFLKIFVGVKKYGNELNEQFDLIMFRKLTVST